MTDQISRIEALRTSVERLRGMVAPLDDDAIVQPAYPSEWTIAEVVSHVGSGAVISRRRLEDELAGSALADDFAPKTWDEWDAKSPRAQVDDGLVADAAFLAALGSLDADQRDAFTFAMGPMSFDFDGFIGLRLNEHALHTWDIDVALDPSATIPAEIAAFVVDGLGMIGRFTAQPTAGDDAVISVRTTDPDRRFTLTLTAEGATLAAAPAIAGGVADVDVVDVELPAEALVRLVYGRLDSAHTPPLVGDPALIERIRATYPGP